jgi:hypothetical protein
MSQIRAGLSQLRIEENKAGWHNCIVAVRRDGNNYEKNYKSYRLCREPGFFGGIRLVGARDNFIPDFKRGFGNSQCDF